MRNEVQVTLTRDQKQILEDLILSVRWDFEKSDDKYKRLTELYKKLNENREYFPMLWDDWYTEDYMILGERRVAIVRKDSTLQQVEWVNKEILTMAIEAIKKLEKKSQAGEDVMRGLSGMYIVRDPQEEHLCENCKEDHAYTASLYTQRYIKNLINEYLEKV